MHLPAHDKMVVGLDFFFVPPFEFGSLFGRHAVGIVRVAWRHGSFVLLVFRGVKFVGKKPLAQFVDPKGGGKIGEREREKAQGIFEGQSVGFQGQDFGTDGDLVRDVSMGGVTVL